MVAKTIWKHCILDKTGAGDGTKVTILNIDLCTDAATNPAVSETNLKVNGNNRWCMFNVYLLSNTYSTRIILFIFASKAKIYK